MTERSDPRMHRDTSDTEPMVGNVKVTRDDWLNMAMAALIRDGVEGVKIQAMGAALGVSRSSFYWYFKSRQDLLDALLDHWRKTNTAALVRMAERPAQTITEAVGNVFRCVINPALFDTRLDFAMRDWARRSRDVRAVLAASDAQRLAALQAMFEKFGYPPLEATARARILYYMQIGYDDAKLNEPMETRNKLMPAYLVGFTGKTPSAREVADLRDYANALERADRSVDGST
ncbi:MULTISPECIES: TetR/AcrR family transcriptional regulator [Roseobacter]|uniref:TetR/AcrR family transcriptional regulator n=1 Tax=Roseobacter TaxID=2433 RepID=UPI001BC1231B|nr:MULTISPECIES: TetR/AcrR family transcriptional regulator [Roseobacter]GIT88398.1 TetR family transcriptional regulator [Roseobacter sp. OBYS 0001]